MRLSTAANVYLFSVANADFNGLRRLPRRNLATLPPLETVGNNGSPASVFPLQECEGDCDDDTDCESGLVCYQRSQSEEVYGCSGPGVSGDDYCFNRPSNFLYHPTADPPHGLCQGDCDNDSECLSGYICFQRKTFDPIPTCFGSGRRGSDYCILDGTTTPTNEPTPVVSANPTKEPTVVTNSPTKSHVGCTEDSRILAYAVNAGGSAYGPASDGYTYTADDGFFVNGNAWSGNPDGAIPYDVDLYGTERNAPSDIGKLVYEFPVEVSKKYKVTLRFMEIWSKIDRRGPRIFDVRIEDKLQWSGVNIYDAVGLAVPYDLEYTYTAVDDMLDIELVSMSQRAKISAIVVEQMQCPTGAPTKSPTTGSPPTNPPPPGFPTTQAPTKSTTPPPTMPPSPPPTRTPTMPPSPPPTRSPTDATVTYVPGDLTVPCEELTLSTGMTCKLLTRRGQRVQFANGGESSLNMHSKADGAGVIAHPDGGWYYVSNSEVGGGNGGAGALRFNEEGEVIDYYRPLTGTSRNCGGGVTSWGTWISCEENRSDGHCHEVDPLTGHAAQTNLVARGGNYESFAYDNQDPVANRYFVTEDSTNGALVRYTPDVDRIDPGNKYSTLTSGGGVHEYLVLNNDNTFIWSSSMSAGESSASSLFPNAEGIDVHNRILNFVSKETRNLFTLDLDAQTWTSSSTQGGAFDMEPDQIGRILGDSDALYFCEDGGVDSDVHTRNSLGEYTTIVRYDGSDSGNEATGLAFSPDGMFMYVAYQEDSNIYAFWRTDNLPFNAQVAEIKYH